MPLRVPILLRCSCLLALLLAGALVAPQARAQTPPGIRTVTTVEGITEYRLDNGLKVLLFPDPSKPTVTVLSRAHVAKVRPSGENAI